MEGNIVVDGVLASCYASYDHDIAHFSLAPLLWFPGIVDAVFTADPANSRSMDIAQEISSLYVEMLGKISA